MGKRQEEIQGIRVEALRREIEEWRRTRAKLGAMPEPLWEAAVAVAQERGVYGTCRALGVSYDALRKRVEGAHGGSRGSKGKAAKFVEVRPAALAPCSGPVVELTTTDGQKVTLRLGQGQELEAAVTALVRAYRNAAR